ncbi:hypothetical protein NA78x_001246 [Anatilimnocola sp. NA78]|uniref:hypothetical protein n=1 Tax=Anatilimnocola sp. NA78 TaxID=3415683 RepID=UPI003CE4D9F0
MIRKAPDADSIIDDIHQTRQHIAEKFAFNVEAILEDARLRQLASGAAVWNGDEPEKLDDNSLDSNTKKRQQPEE